MTSPIVITIPGAKLLSSRGSGSNARQHHHARGREVAEHRQGANYRTVEALCRAIPGVRAEVLRWTDKGLVLMARSYRFASQPADAALVKVRSVAFARLCPKRFFCDGADNLRALFKATLDGVADALGVNDKVFVDNPTESDIQSGKIAIRYEQIDSAWGVRITIEPA